MHRWIILGTFPLLLTACSGASKPLSTGGPPIKPADNLRHQRAAQRPVKALRAGRFDEASSDAQALLTSSPQNPYGRLVRAITGYKKTMHQLSTDARTVLFGAMRAGGFNHRYMRTSLTQAEQELAAVERDLVAADRDGVALELCLACWEVDWNHNGRIDRADRALFAIERDVNGKRIPEGDPRRKPTFRFDRGDVAWARAFVSFQRAALDLVLAYKWTELDKLLQRRGRLEERTIRIKLDKPELVAAARQRILEGIEHSARSRELYLAETDDDREWVPNPRQKNHPMPLPVNAALYETWGAVLGDLRRLVQGAEGLSVEQVAQLGDHVWDNPPRGYVDIGQLLAKPKDIVLDLGQLKRVVKDNDVEAGLRSVLGDSYRQQMKPSPLVGRLARMKGEVKRGEETFERKLRYLIWIN